MADIVYILCAVTSSLVAVLLLKGFRTSRARLLLWSGLCFLGLALNNILLVVDMTVLRQVNMSAMRTLPAVVGVSLLLYGLVWDSK